MQTAIYSLFQRHELAKVKCLIVQVQPVLGPSRHLHILINDEDSHELREFASQRSPYIMVHCEGRNLGVAGGRNVLIARAAAAGAEFFVSCDSDIIYDAAYFDRLERAYERLSQQGERVGFLQSLLLDGRVLRDRLPGLERLADWSDVQRRLENGSALRKNIWQATIQALGEQASVSAVYHSGVSNPWRAHFGAPHDASLPAPWMAPGWQQDLLTAWPTLRSEPELLQRLLRAGEPIRIASSAGGVTAFHRSALEALGPYEELFNPFGYEDSELGLRSLLAGWHNFLVPGAVAIHDIFLGESNRTVLSHSRIGLLRGFEATLPSLGAPESEFVLRQSLWFPWRDLLKPIADEVVAGRLSEADAARQAGDFAASYLFDFLRGALAGLRKPDRAAVEAPWFRLLRGFVDGESEIADFQLPLGSGARFIAGRAIARCRQFEAGSVLSFFASNCRIEEEDGSDTLRSRYFDVAFVARQAGEREFQLSLNVQSDEHLFVAQALAVRAPAGQVRDGSLKIKEFSLTHKAHEYGRFSTEDIYPSPSLFRSRRWLPMAQSFLERLSAGVRIGPVLKLAAALSGYLQKGNNVQASQAPAAQTLERTDQAMAAPLQRKKRLLVFTDSRGQHKPAGQDHPVFGERLAADNRFEVDLFLCPMKWTTTLDFLEQFSEEKLATYDHVILYTGIVDWSPRRRSSAIRDLYDNREVANVGNLAFNTRDYSKKVVNNKRRIFDSVFGEQEMARHFENALDAEYEGEVTANMYGLEMAREALIPKLNAIPNLIFISANRFVPGWRGDYRRERPSNISLTHAYSDAFCQGLSNAKVIDLGQWTSEQVKALTCDNLHLTRAGSDHIYERLMAAMGMQTSNADAQQAVPPLPALSGSFSGLQTPERINAAKKTGLLDGAKRKKHLATLVIGVRVNDADPTRDSNLKFLLSWIDHFYGDLFDVLLVEQDVKPRISLQALKTRPYVRHEFLYNPQEYNRGWGYNVAIARFCPDADVVVLMDTDVLTGANFVREIIDCHTRYDAISPYQNIYYTTAAEGAQIRRTLALDSLQDARKVKNPVTVAGGILIIRKELFVRLKGFEQYVGYGCEDRAFDVTLYNHVDHSRIRIAPQTYAHLWHPSDAGARARFDEIYQHLVTHYGCKYEPGLGPFDFIHQRCHHVSPSATQKLMKERALAFGDPRLYRYDAELTVNGTIPSLPAVARMRDVTYPPAFTSLSDYAERELYAGSPEPDTAELAGLYNAFKGKRCFIIGNGPSLNKHDLALLEGEYSFGVNSFYYKTRETGFRPHFYVVEDSSVMKENIEEIKRYHAPFKFFPTNYRKLHPKERNTIFFRMNRGFYEKSSPNYAVPRFSTDASKVLYCGQSVTYINLQLAYFMGFSEVYLIGMDFSYVIPESHKRTGDVLLSDTDDPNHFHKDYFGKGKTWKDPKLDRVALNYRLAKLIYESTGRGIYNATVGGSLEIFERVDYEGLFRPPLRPDNVTEPSAFAGANAMFRQGRYADALSAYVGLASAHGDFFLYKRSAVNAYMLASENGQDCRPGDVAFVRGLMFNL
ncbi:MAG: 6-hydroxymethylpterin diphosphokinase MptE-like protein [Burkholderiaceae bacterium]